MTREEFEESRRTSSKDVFSYTHFIGQDMSFLDLDEVTFSHCFFDETVFNGSSFRSCVFHRCTFMDCNFGNAVFVTQNVFVRCHMYSCDMQNVVGLPKAVFVNTDNEEGIAGAENLPINCPSTGGFIGWKKCRVINSGVYEYDAIVKLYIPARAKRTTGLDTSHKCRASEAKVLGFYDRNGKPLKLKETSLVCSAYDRDFFYKIGETVRATNTFDETRVTCGAGIHFFLDFKSAVEWILI